MEERKKIEGGRGGGGKEGGEEGRKTHPTKTEVSLELRTGPEVNVAVVFPAVVLCFGVCVSQREERREREERGGLVIKRA